LDRNLNQQRETTVSFFLLFSPSRPGARFYKRQPEEEEEEEEEVNNARVPIRARAPASCLS